MKQGFLGFSSLLLVSPACPMSVWKHGPHKRQGRPGTDRGSSCGSPPQLRILSWLGAPTQPTVIPTPLSPARADGPLSFPSYSRETPRKRSNLMSSWGLCYP